MLSNVLYNVMVTKPRHVILFIITSNDISLNLLIALIYYLFLLNYILDILNFIHLFLEISFFLLHCGSALACHPTIILICTY